MKIEIPTEYGEVVEDHLNDDGLNIVFGMDSHSSYQAQKSLAHLYTHLATNYGLVIFGAEGAWQGIHLPANERKYSADQLHHLIDIGFESFLDFPTQASHDLMIQKAAICLGLELVIPECTLDAQLAIMEASICHFLDLPDEEKHLLRKDIRLFIKQSSKQLPPTYQETLSTIASNVFNISKDTFTSEVYYPVNRIRTEALVNVLKDEFSTSQQDLVLVCRGDDHTAEFSDLCSEKDLGYLLFKPNGLDITDLAQLKKHSDLMERISKAYLH